MYLSHHHREERGNNSATLREAVFGLEDGIVSTLGAVVGIAAGTQNRFVVVLSGLVIIAVESLSMAAGSYISSKSERDLAKRYLDEEAWEIENQPEKEKKELFDFYAKRGFTPDESQILVNRITQDKQLWLEEMAHHELKIFPNELEKPGENAWIMGVSYIIGGSIPLVSFLLLPLSRASIVAIVVSTFALFVVGSYITKYTQRVWWKSGLEMVVIASSAALLGYFIGKVAEVLFPLLHLF